MAAVDSSSTIMTTSMDVLLTGATGHVGSALVDALLRAGHDVTAVVRSPQKADALARRGVTPLIADLTRADAVVGALGRTDAIVHAAYDSRAPQSLDRLAVDALISAAQARASLGHNVTFIYTSGAWVLGDTPEPAHEATVPAPPPLVAWRPAHEQLVLQAAGLRLRTLVVRPGIVYGGARGFISEMLKEAGNGLIRVVGKGQNHWACVYDRDLADLYVRLLANDDASGIYHANDEADERLSDIVGAIVDHARATPDIRHMPLPEARAKLGPLAEALALDQRIRSQRARALGWAPTLHSVAGNVARLLEEFRDAEAA